MDKHKHKHNERVVIIVPSQGHDTNSFLAVAKSLSTRVYPHATIVKTTVSKHTGSDGTASGSVTLTKLDGTEFKFDGTPHLTRVLTVSHAFSGAGQNLTYGDSSFGDDGSSQPWGTPASDGSLSEEGKSFWTTVGDSMRPDGKIIMLGCYMGFGNYAENVAKTAHEPVYASTSLFGAGDEHSALGHVHEIEKGHIPKPLKRFNP